MNDISAIDKYFNGIFVSDVSTIQQKLLHIKAFVFDWDGVFNDGRKNIDGHSNFSETDSMGVNMMRFSHYLIHHQLPLSIIFTGENNKLALSFAERENFNSVYHKTANKKLALDHFCSLYKISPSEILFVFDDVLDFTVAEFAGVRCMVKQDATVLLQNFAMQNNLVDYITKNSGGNNAVREVSELIMMLSNNFDETINERMHYSETYKRYLVLRKNITLKKFTTKDQMIVGDL